MWTGVKALRCAGVALGAALLASTGGVITAAQTGTAGRGQAIPSVPMTFGAFTATFSPDGAFALEGQGWPALKGTWTASGEKVEIVTSGGGAGCTGPGRYAYRVEGGRVAFALQSDDCEARRMILDRSTWTPAGTPVTRPARRIVRTAGARGPLPKAAAPEGSWPSFRGAQASGVADGQHLPDRWDGTTGDHILWKTPCRALPTPVRWSGAIASMSRPR